MSDPNEQPGDGIAADVEKHTGDQDPTVKRPVYPVTTLVRRDRPGIGILATPAGDRIKYSPTQLRTLYEARDLLHHATRHADDGSKAAANDTLKHFTEFLFYYPVTWSDPKPKTETPESQRLGPDNVDLAT